MNEIEYKGKRIKYKIVKSRIKNLYIHIKEGEVTVKAPIRLKEDSIHKFVYKKAKWIYEKVTEYQKQPHEKEIFEESDSNRLELIVKKNIEKYSEILQIRPKKVRIKEIKYAWGSCSSKQNITINLKLAKKDEKIIEYVVLHEMCHLKQMNHSKEFWKLVETQMPQYKTYKKALQ